MDQRVRLAPFCAAVFAGLLAAATAFAADSNSAPLPDPDPPWEQVNQVLEIPQHCSQEAVAALCDRSDADVATEARPGATWADDGAGGPDADWDGASAPGDNVATQANDGGAQDPPAMAALSNGAANQAFGSVYDYQNQYGGNAREIVRPPFVAIPAWVPVMPVVPVYSYPRAYSYAPRYAPRVRRPFAPLTHRHFKRPLSSRGYGRRGRR